MTCVTHTCQLCLPTIVDVSLKRLFGMAVVLCWSLWPKSCWRNWTSIFRHTRHPPRWKTKAFLDNNFWTPFFLSFFLRSRCVYSVFRHVRRFRNRVHLTFGCYLITIKLSILFLKQSCVFISINPPLLFKCA